MTTNKITHNTMTLQWVRRIATAGTAFSLIVILMGVATRLTDAGLGCPDWPGCYGKLVVPSHEVANAFAPQQPLEPFKAWMEMIHRYLASTLGLFAITLVIMAMRHYRFSRTARVDTRSNAAGLLRWSLVLLVVICVQGAFGAWTVTMKLWPQVVTLHLLGGLSCMSLFAIVRWRSLSNAFSNSVRSEPCLKKSNILWTLVLSIVVLQIALGGWTSSNYAAVGCVGLPTCNGEWWPSMNFGEGFHLTQTIGPDYLYGQLHAEARTAIHFIHRLNAVALGLILVLVTAWAYRTGSNQRRSWLLCLGVYSLQLTLGLLLVLSHIDLWVALAHTIGAAALLLVLLRMQFLPVLSGQQSTQHHQQENNKIAMQGNWV